jgi:hypothetical protein
MLPIMSGMQNTENIANLEHFNKEVSDDLLLHSSIHVDLPFRVKSNCVVSIFDSASPQQVENSILTEDGKGISPDLK